MIKLKKTLKVIVKILSIFLIIRFSLKTREGFATEAISGEADSPKLFLVKKVRGFRIKDENKIITPCVSIVKGDDLYSMTKKALDLIGGMREIVKPGQKVFIKPNYISGGLDGHDAVTAGEIAHPEVVAAVSEECLKAGAKQVIIGEWVERPLKINFGGKENKEGAQIKGLIDILNKKYGEKIYLLNLMEHTTYFQYVPSKTELKFLAIPNLVTEADVIISIPSLKTHHKPCPVSLGMKNFMGIMPAIFYGEPRYKLHEAGVHQVIVDINKALNPDLVVIDGSFGMEGRGASLFLGGKPVNVEDRIGGFLVIAGRDPVATDATATRIITKGWNPLPEGLELGSPWYIHHIRMASEQGLGILDSSKISILGEELKNVEMKWEQSDDNVYPEIPDEGLTDEK